MANNPVKIFVQRRLNETAINRASEIIQQTGRALPCKVTKVNGNLITVSFNVQSDPWTLSPITIPKLESEWLQSPTQVGDTGITIAADAYLDNISGQSSAVPDLTKPLNLSALAFIPIKSVSIPVSDPNAAVIQGPNGAIIKTKNGDAEVKVSETGIFLKYKETRIVEMTDSKVDLSFNANKITINASGVTISGTTVIINGIDFTTHVHGGVTPGGSNTTGPV